MTLPTIHFDAYPIALVLGVLLALAAMTIAWRRRQAPGAVPLLVFSAASVWWMVGSLLWRVLGTGADPMIWFKLIFAGVVLVSPAFLVFALQYGNRSHWVTRRFVALLAIEPILFNIAVWTDSYHGLVAAGWQGRGYGDFVGGIVFWMHSFYSYALLIPAYILLINGFLRAPPIYRRQSGMIIIGACAPLFGNALTIFHLSPLPGGDLTPFGLVISSAVISTALFRRGLLDLVPIARDAVVERMHDGVLVLDSQNRLVDLNPAARTLLGIDGTDVLGKPAAVAMGAWHGYSPDYLRLENFHDEVLIGADHYVDLRITALSDKRSQLGGRLMVLRDITPLKQASAALQDANDRLRQQLIEIEVMQGLLKEQAICDSLTGLYNRRFLEETLIRELGQAARSHAPVSVVLIDLDHFKSINDAHGHLAGDLLLRSIGDLLRLSCRAGDAACRFGGEEFIVILPGTSFAVALQRAEQWRQEFMALRVQFGHSALHATFSAGVATFPTHGEEFASLMNAADIALYAAKEQGRNRVLGADQIPV
jgi:diguanylate cyclase (GGDEF)-like protein/PAS domain S-box-containing protein